MTKVLFKYSWIYDQNWKQWSAQYPWLAKGSYPTSKEIQKGISRAEKAWRKIEAPVLKEIEKVTGLRWTEKEIQCYVVGKARGFSDPFTMSIEKDIRDFIDTLVHELLHQIFAVQKGNMKRTSLAWKYIYSKYKKEDHTTKVHIPVHAVHRYLYLKFFNKKRMENDISLCQRVPSYKRSWEIVDHDGYLNIIEEFKKRIV